MTSEEPTPKRPRTYEEEQPLRRNGMLWFEDGNVVLVAENVAVKVHRGVLARQSSVFKDMFSMPQPAASTETYEDHPMVRLYDNPMNLSFFLRTFYDGFKCVIDNIDTQ